MLVAVLPRHLLVDQPLRGLEVEHRDLRFEQRGLHPLALAGDLAFKQCGQDAHRAEVPGTQIGQRNADPHRAVFGLAGHAHQAAHPLGNRIEARPVGVRAVLPKARNAGVDEARVDRAQLVGADAEPVLDVGAVVLDEHVGLLDELMQDRHAFRLLHVQGQAFLVAVQVLVVGAVVVAPADHVVAAGGAGRDLELDDTRTHVGEQAHGRGAGAHAGGVEDGEAGQCTVAHGFLLGRQAGVNIGTGWPPSLGLKTTLTRWPMSSVLGSQSTRLLISVTPSSSVTKASV